MREYRLRQKNENTQVYKNILKKDKARKLCKRNQRILLSSYEEIEEARKEGYSKGFEEC